MEMGRGWAPRGAEEKSWAKVGGPQVGETLWGGHRKGVPYGGGPQGLDPKGVGSSCGGPQGGECGPQGKGAQGGQVVSPKRVGPKDELPQWGGTVDPR